MKNNKKFMMGISFGVGALMFVSTAYADIASKSGYDQLKDAVKYTAESCTTKLQNFTLEGAFTLKDDNKALISSNFTGKFDNTEDSSENSSTTQFSNGEKEESYSYSDSKQGIWYNSNENVYYVTDYSGKHSGRPMENPFKKEKAKDAEKIFDAVIGNLRDYIVVEEKTNGSKEFSGALSEAQIPALVNAVSSFGLKQASSDIGRNSNMIMTDIKDDIFIKNVKGRAITNKDGVIENLFASGELSGKDSKGNIHNITLELLIKVDDINATTVAALDLSGKKVEKRTENVPSMPEVSKRFVGKYKNDIVIVKNDSFIKIGERFVDIVEADGKHVAGKYYEQYKPEYSQYEGSKNEFTFDAKIDKNLNANFVYTNSSGVTKKGSLSFDIMFGKIYTNMDSRSPYDSVFARVFEN